ncbi:MULTISPECIES: PepSY domain-containing protein [Comamonadaceae]|uniref:PepSY domain-containing protein n=1 Tax=Comamonadaceae TaxID=80864 RepID=UPI00272FC720|nr:MULTISPECIES: PepSY domain-containing protein [Comamonadaceae]MDP1888591.1 PepSY domain-containing protein [Polaromonas sp.]MDP2988062.1 PepSY domain-containing protein [Hydrogenophaga sp.]MDP3350006.1 PepSY domain-containing protein [Hydrogenophaga sp.]MDZ4396515.1 PepSY domain-containing protein [Hydrogenophaga sp.]
MTPPRSPTLRHIALTSLLAGALLSAPASASDRDHDRAREAVKAGQVMPLRTVLERLEREHPGQVLDVELEDEHGRLVYEVKLLQNDGRLVKLELDAKTATVLRRKDRDRRD